MVMIVNDEEALKEKYKIDPDQFDQIMKGTFSDSDHYVELNNIEVKMRYTRPKENVDVPEEDGHKPHMNLSQQDIYWEEFMITGYDLPIEKTYFRVLFFYDSRARKKTKDFVYNEIFNNYKMNFKGYLFYHVGAFWFDLRDITIAEEK